MEFDVFVVTNAKSSIYHFVSDCKKLLNTPSAPSQGWKPMEAVTVTEETIELLAKFQIHACATCKQPFFIGTTPEGNAIIRLSGREVIVKPGDTIDI